MRPLSGAAGHRKGDGVGHAEVVLGGERAGAFTPLGILSQLGTLTSLDMFLRFPNLR